MFNFSNYSLFLLISLLLITNWVCMTPLTAQTAFTIDEPVNDNSQLKILSWNIYMLPPLIKFTGKLKRAKHIAAFLKDSDYDIIVFQEAFHRKARKHISKGLKESFPYQLGPANRKKISIKLNSGIWIWSKIPLEELGTIQFNNCVNENCMARKGALLAQGKHGKHTFQVLGTHLDSGGRQKERNKQCEQIKAFLDKHKKDKIPQFVCGDFNTLFKKKEQYQSILKILTAENGPLSGELQNTFDGHLNDLNHNTYSGYIDFIFHRSNNKKLKRIQRKIIRPLKHWHKKCQDLSDHFGIEATIWF